MQDALIVTYVFEESITKSFLRFGPGYHSRRLRASATGYCRVETDIPRSPPPRGLLHSAIRGLVAGCIESAAGEGGLRDLRLVIWGRRRDVRAEIDHSARPGVPRATRSRS